ncbi:MAG: hypothetical protein Q8O89_05250 [Nanoarchaeota archaeon]|nr:hypothetical protein [Nanoarchaeota archaeon]
MTQIEQKFIEILAKEPEIEKCYSKGLVNRRALARYLVKKGIFHESQMDTLIGMIRRHKFKTTKDASKLIKNIRINIKDNILILDFEKEKNILHKIENLISRIDYDKGEILKIVVGTTNVKIFVDDSNEKKVLEIFSNSKLISKHKNISEMSLIFLDEAIDTKGILSLVTREFALNDINITELLTATPELLIYLKENHVVKAYEIIKRFKIE